jgi:hypothetical protein
MTQEFQTGGASLAQLADQTGKMMKHAVKLGKTAHYSAVLATMAKVSLAQQVEAADVERLVQLLNNLREVISDAFAEFTSENNHGIELFMA